MSEDAVGATVKALKGRGLFESLAEPNLVTQDGKEASFLAGGEFPYPVVQGGGANQSVTIVFKEFGVRLRFTPTLTGGGFVHLKVVPEVSSLDFGNAVTLEGFRVPALKTRRTETEVELRDGQTFAISGLLDRNMDETLRRVPGIGDIPILGYLFRSQAYQKNNTELVVMITPHILRRDSPGVTPNLPGLSEPFLAAPTRTIPMPPPAFSGMGTDAPAGPTRTVVSNAPVAPNAVASAAAPVAPAAPVARVAPMSPAASSVSSEDRRAAERAQKEIARLEREQAERAQKAAVIAAEARETAEEGRRCSARSASRSSKRSASKNRRRSTASAGSSSRTRRRKAKVVADKLAKEQARRDAEQQKIDNARLEEEQKLAEKHQKEKERLAREQASRDGELEKLITQYKRLTGEQAMTRLQSRLRDERGMTLVMVATGLVAFLSATMLAVDVGMLMVARTEAQSVGRCRRAGRRRGAWFRRLRRPLADGPAVRNAIAASTAADNGVMNTAGIGPPGGRHVSGHHSDSRAGAAQRRARQSAHDLHRADVRHPHRRPRRGSDC